jgi:hypothetical protein
MLFPLPFHIAPVCSSVLCSDIVRAANHGRFTAQGVSNGLDLSPAHLTHMANIDSYCHAFSVLR